MKTVQRVLVLLCIIGGLVCGCMIANDSVNAQTSLVGKEDSKLAASNDISTEDMYTLNELDYILFVVDFSVVIVLVMYTNSYLKLVRWNEKARKSHVKQKKENQELFNKYPFE